jgi:hypothetical protein
MTSPQTKMEFMGIQRQLGGCTISGPHLWCIVCLANLGCETCLPAWKWQLACCYCYCYCAAAFPIPLLELSLQSLPGNMQVQNTYSTPIIRQSWTGVIEV